MYVIAGATGRTGAVVAEALLAMGKPVTVLARSEEKGKTWKARGAEVIIAELEDSAAISKAFEGADGAYLLIPPDYEVSDYLEDRRRLAEALAKAVADSGVPHVVLLSSIGAQHDSGTGLILNNHQAEMVIGPAAKKLTIIRASFFLENWAAALDSAKSKGVLPSFLTPDHKVAMIATTDIGRTVAESLTHPPENRHIVELAGPEEYSPVDLAGTLESLLGHPVRVNTMPPSASVSVMGRLGFSDDVCQLFQEMYEGINSGRVAFEGKGAEFRRGGIKAGEVFHHLMRK